MKRDALRSIPFLYFRAVPGDSGTVLFFLHLYVRYNIFESCPETFRNTSEKPWKMQIHRKTGTMRQFPVPFCRNPEASVLSSSGGAAADTQPENTEKPSENVCEKSHISSRPFLPSGQASDIQGRACTESGPPRHICWNRKFPGKISLLMWKPAGNISRKHKTGFLFIVCAKYRDPAARYPYS